MRHEPLVSIILISYNHEQYISDCVFSVLRQSYLNWELLMIDDYSVDGSGEEVTRLMKLAKQHFPDKRIEASIHKENVGICKRFNEGLSWAKGKYIVDLAADDVLLYDRLEKQVSFFEPLGGKYALVYSNAILIDEKGDFLKYHFPIDMNMNRIQSLSGYLYTKILQRYFICPPTILYKKEVLDDIGGYDESLSYEDFDIWVRTSKKYLYGYLNEVTTLKRELDMGASKKFYQIKNNSHLASTLKICCKAYEQNQTAEEHLALRKCVSYHFRQCYFTQNYDLVFEYDILLRKIGGKGLLSALILLLAKWKVPVFFLYRLYLQLRK
jgi:glycosyltransferase involved in cell wall biosynthesis